MTKKIKIFGVFLGVGVVALAIVFIYSGRGLRWAMDNRHPALLDSLLRVGAPVDADFGAYRNPITHAVANGNLDAITVLVRHGVKLDAYPFSDLSLLAWAYSVSQGAEIGEALLAAGADVDFLAIPTSGKTVLMYLLSYETLSLDKIRSVLGHRPDLGVRDAEGLSSVDYFKKREIDLRALGFREDELLSIIGEQRPDNKMTKEAESGK